MQKWMRLKAVKNELKTSSHSCAELEKMVYGTQNDRNNRRTMQNYLQELVQIEDIYFDQKTGNYVSREADKLTEVKLTMTWRLPIRMIFSFIKMEKEASK